MDLLHLPWISGHPSTALYDQQDWGGWDHHYPLPVLSGPLPRFVSCQLDLALLFRGLFWPYCCGGWCSPDHSILRLLLLVHHKSTQGKEAQFASVSAKDHQQPLSFRVHGQNSYHSKGMRCLVRKIRNLTLLLQTVISGSVRMQRKRTRRFLFYASCLIFFYYYVQRFFYTKKLKAVLINSVCSLIGIVPKVMIFVRNKCKLFLFLKILGNCWLCLQWNCTPWQLVDYLF